jgi:hypothetical protein
VARPSGAAPLDRPLARGIAAGVFVACLALLVWLEREQLFPSEVAADADDPVQRCIAERAADIDGMLAEGVIEAPQAELFKARAAAMCQDTVGNGGGGPAPPPLPAQ